MSAAGRTVSWLLLLAAGCSRLIDTSATFDDQADGSNSGGADISSVLGGSGSGGGGAAGGSTSPGAGEGGIAEGGEIGAAGQAPQGGAGGAPGVRECEPSVRFCSDRGLRECDESGLFSEEVQTCASNEYCDAVSATCKTGVCSPDTPSCDGVRATICNATGSGYLAGGTVCGADSTCDAGACKEQVCEPGEDFCQGQQVRNCASNGLASTIADTCRADEYCAESTAQCVDDNCISGTRQCAAGRQPELCNTEGSAWIKNGAACSGDTPVCFEGGCVECSPESKGCAGTVPRLCSEEGSWIAQPACDYPESICVPATATCTHPDPLETAGLVACGEEAESFCDVSENGALAYAAQVVCCLVYYDAGSMAYVNAYGCSTRSECPTGPAASSHGCDVSNDCPPGQVCCYMAQTNGRRTYCSAECDDTTTAPEDKYVCDLTNADSCPDDRACVDSGFFSAAGVGICP